MTCRDCAISWVRPSNRANLIGSMIPNMRDSSRPYFTSLKTRHVKFADKVWFFKRNVITWLDFFLGSSLVHYFKNTHCMKNLIAWANSWCSGGQKFSSFQIIGILTETLKTRRTARTDRDQVSGRGPTGTVMKEVRDRVTIFSSISVYFFPIQSRDLVPIFQHNFGHYLKD